MSEFDFVVCELRILLHKFGSPSRQNIPKVLTGHDSSKTKKQNKTKKFAILQILNQLIFEIL